MKLKKPKFWDYKHPSLLSYLLYPLSKIFELITKLNFKKQKSSKNIKTICVGNIYIGGTGKTSLAIELKKILDKKEIKSCFIKKYHSDQIDEIKLLEKFGKVFLEKSRFHALEKAHKENFKIAIFDDGLQDNNISYDISFVCFNKKNFIGNGFLIPSGPLRENLNNLKNYQNIFLNGNNEDLTQIKNTLMKKNVNSIIFDSEYDPLNIKDFNLNDSYVVFSGIGNHATFVDMLNKNKFNIMQDIEFPAHYEYSEDDIKKIIELATKNNAKILTTEKDYLRLEKFRNKDIKYIKVQLKIKDTERLKKLLDKLHESY